MATRRWGIKQGERFPDVTEAVGAAVSSDTIELTVDLADGLNREEVLEGLDYIRAHILKGDWPPA